MDSRESGERGASDLDRVEPARFTDALEPGAPDDEHADEGGSGVRFAEFGSVDALRASDDERPGFTDAELLDASPDAGPLAPAQALPQPGVQRFGVKRAARAPAAGEVARGRDRFAFDATPVVAAQPGADGDGGLPPRPGLRSKPPDPTGSGSAPPPVACPACSASNTNDARRCGRCGAEIPPPFGIGAPPPGARGATFSPGAALAMRVTPAEAPPAGDVLDVVPADVRERVLAARAASAAHTVSAEHRDRARQVAIVATVAGLAVACGLVISLIMGVGGLAMLGIALADAIAFAAATWWIERSDSTSLHGLALLGVVALVTGGLRIALGPSGVAFGALLGIMAWTSGWSAVGRILGQHVLDRPSSGT